MTWVVEMTGIRISDSQQVRFLFSLGAGLALTDDSYCEPALLGWASPSQSIDIGKNGEISTRTDAGSVEISNVQPSITQPGPWDNLLDYVWNGRFARLWWIPGNTWAAAVPMAWGTLEQPVGTILGGGGAPSIKFPLRDPRAALEAAMQPIKYLGTNSGPTGVEGGPDLKGRPKPILYGTASNLPIPCVNESLLIYQVADKIVSVLCARDGGSPITAGVVRGTLASMQSNNPGGGKYDIYQGAEGTFVRLGTKPIWGLTVDASEGATNYRTHAEIWRRIRTERCGTDSDTGFNTDSITAANNADPAEAGFWWNDETTQRQAVDQVLGSFGAFEVNELSGAWKIQKLTLPTGTTVIDLVVLTPGLAMTPKNRGITSLQRLRPGYAPNGVPPYRVTVKWGRNYAGETSPASMAGNTLQRLKEKFAVVWRLETWTDNLVWNPVANTGLWPNAPELTVESGYQPGPDGVTSPDAGTEAARLLVMYSTLRGQYQVSFRPELNDRLQAGDVVKLTYAGMNLAAGKLFRVLQAGFLVGSKGAEVDLVVGLES